MKSSDLNLTRMLKFVFLSSILGLSVLTTACSNNSSESKQASENGDEKKSKPAVPVEVITVKRGDIKKTYRTITTLEAENDAQVVARSTGLLQKINVEEGDVVTKGQLLAQLDIEQLSLEVAQMEATSRKLKKELDRQQAIFGKNLGSVDALDRAKFEFQSQQAQYKLAKLKLEYASIRAPIDGIVTERFVKSGNLIRENDILFHVINPNSLKAILHLPERELLNVKTGQNVFLYVDAYADKNIIGQIERIRPLIDTDTGTFKVVAKLDNSEGLLRTGMFGKVEVVFDVHQDSLLLEQQAIITQDNRSHVFVIKDDKAIQTPVTIGFTHNGIAEITSGLTEQAKVVTTGQQILKHETLVEIVTDKVEQVVEEESTSTAANVAVNN